MKLISNGAICAVKSKEARRKEKWRQHNLLTARNKQLAREKGGANSGKAKQTVTARISA
jgi:hypothetical protein